MSDAIWPRYFFHCMHILAQMLYPTTKYRGHGLLVGSVEVAGCRTHDCISANKLDTIWTSRSTTVIYYKY
jgi:hypothetical protein